MSDSDRAWQKWGEIDPYFGVVSHDKFRRENISETLGDFFQSGEQYINDRIVKFERHFGPLARARALDFGCGVGRLTLPLAAKFDETVGVDIAPAMLAEARKAATQRHIANVQFVESDDALSRASGKFDFVHSFIVLQHIPVSRGLPIIAQLLDRVAPGGGASLHFSVDRCDTLPRKAVYWARKNVPFVDGITNVARGRSWSEPLMQMNEYPIQVIFRMMMERGFEDIVSDLEYHGRVLTMNTLTRRQ